jgi:hypothetical protein
MLVSMYTVCSKTNKLLQTTDRAQEDYVVRPSRVSVSVRSSSLYLDLLRILSFILLAIFLFLFAIPSTFHSA